MSHSRPFNTDGRVARRERTREAIVAAHIALLEEGELSPTGEQIARRAGVSLRAFWLTVKDMDGLFGAVAEEVFQRMQQERRPVSADLPLPDRIDAYCRERARLLEIVTPFARASATRSPSSTVLRDYEQRHVRQFAKEIETLFGAELPVTGSARDQYVRALAVATTWASWSMSREALELSVTEATEVLARTFTDLLAAAATQR